MAKSTILKDLLSEAGTSLMKLRHATPEQLRRFGVPFLRALNKEITAGKKKPAKTS